MSDARPPRRRVVAVIPARGGSKGVPGKNLARVGGRPLVVRAVEACTGSGQVDVVAVSTDDAAIGAAALGAGAVVIDRPVEIAGDLASSESALLHALDVMDRESGSGCDVVVFVQCTSPFVDPDALAEAIRTVRDGRADSVFAAVETYEFLWEIDAEGLASGVNHDHRTRPRRQDREPHWRETGAFYVMDASGFRSAGHRFFGRVAVQPVAAADAIEIDTPEELDMARVLASSRRQSTPGLDKVRVLVTDFDGVHTDDRALVSEDGVESVVVSRRDGHGVKLLRAAGIPVLILSTETNSVVARRAAKLGVECLHGIDDKWTALRRWLAEEGFTPAEVAYIGNDVNDLECMEHVGSAIAVADADERARAAAGFVTQSRGGAGAVRELAEAILAARAPTGFRPPERNTDP